MNSLKDKRRHQRIFFSEENQIPGYFSLSGVDGKTLTASILNISEGGLCFAFMGKGSNIFQKGNRLILKGIKKVSALKGISEVEMEIKWIYDDKAMEHIGIGCRFMNPSEPFREILRQLIDTESANF